MPDDMLNRRFLLARSLVLAGVCSLHPVVAALAAGAPAELPASPAVTTTAKRPIVHSDYAQWRSIQGAALSRDGRFAAYALVGQESDGELVVRRLADGQEWRVPRGLQPQFSADSRYLAFAQAPTRAAQDQARKDKKKGDDAPKPGAGWMDLSDGRFETVDLVKRFAFAEDGGSSLALWLEPAAKPERKAAASAGKADASAQDTDAADQTAPSETGFFGASHASAEAGKKKEQGSPLLLVNPADGQRQRLEDVSSFLWSRDGRWLAYAVSPAPVKDGKAAGPARAGVHLLPGQGGEPRLLLGGAGLYKQLQFDTAGRQLAFVSNRDHLGSSALEAHADTGTDPKAAGKDKDKDKDEAPATPFKLYLWQEAGEAGAVELLAAGSPGLREGFAPSEHASLRFSKDGARLFLGTAPLPKEAAKDAPEPMKVDLWHWKDPELQSMQKVRAEKEKLRSYRAVIHLAQPAGSRFVQLATPELPEVVVNDNAEFALGFDELPYRALQSWDSLYRDAYAVNLRDGSTRLLARKLRGMPLLSPAGRYVTAFLPERSQWMAWRTRDGSERALTAAIKGEHFENVERDVVEPADAYGQVGWMAEDRAVVLNAQHHLWSVDPESLQARRLTEGLGKAPIQMRLQRVDEDGGDREERHHKPLPAGPWILLGPHEQDKSTAFYRLDPAGPAAPERLLHKPQLLGGLLKARDAEVWLHTAQDFRTFPDLWLSQGPLGQQGQPQRLSNANPQQAQLRWGTQEIVSYTSAKGRPLRALLAKPEDFDPKKKYPLMVYIYEKMTDNLHRYVPPAPGQNINLSRYVSKGYLVLRPDIVYTIGHPGQSAMDTVIPAIRQLVKKGYVDEKRIGIQGHSWGAYQINYLLTRTTMFRAAEAGASMANMVSGYGGIRWGTGKSRAFQYEQQQSRIGATPWQRPDLYVENSPIFRIDRVTTPYLTVHNDEDDAVPYYQAIEFFTALRRLGKEAYWFNYNGEKHGLRDREALKHFTVHMSEFFDHYLLNEPRPAWMDQPVPYLERGKRDVMPLFKPAGVRSGERAPVIEDPAAPPQQPLQTR